MDIVQKLLKTLKSLLLISDDRKSRFHDLSGQFMPAWEALTIPWELLMRLIQVERKGPWMSRSAVRQLNFILSKHLSNEGRVLEIGGGLSTPWIAKRCLELITVEPDQGWSEKIEEALGKEVKNVKLVKTGFFDSVISLQDSIKSVDVVIIDGETDSNRVLITDYLFRENKNAIFVVDNSDRKSMRGIFEILSTKKLKRITGIIRRPFQVTQTCFFY